MKKKGKRNGHELVDAGKTHRSNATARSPQVGESVNLKKCVHCQITGPEESFDSIPCNPTQVC